MCPVRIWFAVVSFNLVAGSITHAGDLNPPGPPTPTRGPEPRILVSEDNTPGDDAAFFIITRPGSYYLGRNISNPLLSSSRNGIVIESSDVTLDLNGFTLDGYEPFILPLAVSSEVGPTQQLTTGILASGGVLTNVTVRNGHVRDWGGDGVGLGNTEGAIIEDLTAASNSGNGIRGGISSLIRRCTSVENTGSGFSVSTGSSVIECVAHQNVGRGFSISTRCNVQLCTAYQNGDDGFDAENGTVISNCAANGNSGDGIRVNGSCLIVHCTAHDNDNNGFRVGNSDIIECLASSNAEAGIFLWSVAGRAEGCTSRNNVRGFETQSGGNLIVRNRAGSNSQSNYGAITGGNQVGTIVTSPVNAGAWDNIEQ